MNHIEQLIANGYLVLHKEDAREHLSEETYRELIQAMEKSLKKRNGTPLSEQETRDMEDYFSSRLGQSPKTCPSCGSPVIHQGGCLECSNPSCGWAACG
ncbi:MAG: hypothetical protein KC917_05910 [Candidatus Omnitrophica bacterium]|nr:hypothetical protein [Candidatus Omnitrophota bacterium]MCA9415783.1 hypothetical protein [Candidatus Omnitrophota bacterium]MCA9423739.1 hypothetical protein [Candidatus Omnitrophota bacterium]MCA9432250.1 hypothetical protein [Candidatus Omnitrophota bacterium]MCA9434725.1 hypothetical protein [Candidatus Omnitrophota bacterium]